MPECRMQCQQALQGIGVSPVFQMMEKQAVIVESAGAKACQNKISNLILREEIGEKNSSEKVR